MSKHHVVLFLLLTLLLSCESSEYPDESIASTAIDGYIPAPPPILEIEEEYIDEIQTLEHIAPSSKKLRLPKK
jgi:hypothetical protein